LVLVVGGAFAIGYVKHEKGAAEPIAVHGEGTTKVEVFSAKSLQSDQALMLPGNARAFEEAKIYPRAAGYVKRWLVDIGDKVTEGQLLAEIEAPDVDAQLAQARAQLAQARASLVQAQAQRDYSKSNAERNVVMANQQLIAKGTLEQATSQAKVDEATVTADQANIAAMEANVRRLTEMTGFQKVTAPFAGTVTSRTIDRGNLVGDSTTAAVSTPMFTIVATDPIRVFVDVPQTVAPTIQAGGDATVLVREFPGRKFPGKVTRSARVLDPNLHVMQTELSIPNPDGTLLPGMYVQAQLSLPVPHRVLEVPATALYSDAQGLRVATVDAQGKIHYAPITIERDTGATLWIATGLTGDEKIVKIAVPSLLEGDSVEAAAAPAPASAGSGSAK
jgi:RND family efflux transporter MFP subunit